MIPGRRWMDMDHAEGRTTGEGEGGLLPIHVKDQFCLRKATGDTPWHRSQANSSGAKGRGSAT